MQYISIGKYWATRYCPHTVQGGVDFLLILNIVVLDGVIESHNRRKKTFSNFP